MHPKRVFLARTDVFAFSLSHLKGAKPCKDSFAVLDCYMIMGTTLSIVEWSTTNYDTGSSIEKSLQNIDTF